MRIFLTGVSCVGKTTIGKKLAELLDVNFFDLDTEVELFFKTSIEHLQKKFITIHSFRNEAAKALVHLLGQPKSKHSIIALPPSGLMGGYLRVMKKTNGITAVVTDRPENILKRISFYDIDSCPIEKKGILGQAPRNNLRAICLFMGHDLKSRFLYRISRWGYPLALG